eukprot:GEMP01000497.1.p1 GENE.GEMP01000497.1~~GEMP01000497.1.p1  ORF type:complete len:1071 (+),score=261.07 GEMP01000497.1:3-3215(+)
MESAKALGDILSKSKSAESFIPAPHSPAWYDSEHNRWTDTSPSKQETKHIQACRILAHLAPTGRASCRRCGRKIDKNTLRVGYPLQISRRDGLISVYLHVECFIPSVFNLSVSDLPKLARGFTELSQKHQALLKKAVAGKLDQKEKAEDVALEDHCGTDTLSLAVVPSVVTGSLLKFQKEGLSWMVKQEDPKRSVRGGILGDEMGMGKTLQMIALMAANRNKGGFKGGQTLVVAPVAAVPQWVDEIEKFTKKGTFKVIVYHGNQRKAINFSNYDVVITTYQTLECEYRKEMDRYKVACMYCRKLFHKSKLETHQRYFCGPEAEKTAKQAKQEKKSRDAAKKAMGTMSIGDSPSDAPPTISNIYKDIMRGAGIKIEAKGYWQIQTEARKRLAERVEEEGPTKKAKTIKGAKNIAAKNESDDEEPKKGKKAAKGAKKDMAENSVVAAAQRLSKTDIKKLKVYELQEICANLGIKLKGSKDELAAVVLNKLFPEKKKARTVATNDSVGSSTDGKKKPMKPKISDAPTPDNSDSDSDTDEEHDLSGSKLHNMKWSRVILDEAHRIKARTISTAMAAYALKGDVRWCVTGTPLQNRIGELYSLVRFLQFKPFAYYYCKTKGCDCEQLCFMGNMRYCPHCNHNRMMHYSHFKRTVSNPIMKFGLIGAGKDAYYLLQNEVLKTVMLRRTKLQKKDDMNLPPLEIVIRQDELSPEEKDFYESLYRESRTKFDTYVKNGSLMHNYAHIFDLLTSLRRACDHPYLVIHSKNAKVSPNQIMDICHLCQDSIEEEAAQTACSCTFHGDCLREYVDEAPIDATCPGCFLPLSTQGKNTTPKNAKKRPTATTPAKSVKEVKKEVLKPAAKGKAKKEVKDEDDNDENFSQNVTPTRTIKGKESILQRVRGSDYASSTKIEALISEIESMPQQDKAIVFSQFTTMLDLISFALKRRNIQVVCYSGSMSMERRAVSLKQFHNDPRIRIILISLKAGGEGLNLQVANHVFLMDPWWNPASELQAIQRAHRIGQTKKVRAVRLVTTNTIETKILQLQEKKQLVFDGAVDGSIGAMQKLTANDMQFLFAS